MMPGENPVLPLRDHWEALCCARMKAAAHELDELRNDIATRIEFLQQVRHTEKNGIDKRLDIMNEFRSSLEDQTREFMRRTEFELAIKAIESDIRILRDANAKAEGKASQSAMIIAYIIAILSGMISITGLVVQWAKK